MAKPKKDKTRAAQPEAVPQPAARPETASQSLAEEEQLILPEGPPPPPATRGSLSGDTLKALLRQERREARLKERGY